MGVRVAILGALEAEVDGSPVDLGPPKQRAVLAFLAAHAGTPVSVDRLIEELWGDQAPPRATASLQAYVSNLRRLLEPQRQPRTPATVLVSRPPGYALVLGDGDLDAARFSALVEDADAASTAGAPTAALEAVDAALALWRGEPLADFAYEPFAVPARAALEGTHLRARRIRAEALAAVGHHDRAAVELAELTTAHPLDEGLWSSRMRAEYRAGRQADALRSYQEARRHLADELGLEPGPELRRLEEQVLAHDPALLEVVTSSVATSTATPPHPTAEAEPSGDGAPAPAPGSAPALGPGSAPPAPRLLGRDEERRALARALHQAADGRTAFALVSGEPGIGKTTLVEAALAEAPPSAVVLWGRCFDQAGAAGLWPWAQVVRGLLGPDPVAQAEVVLGPRAHALGPLVPELAVPTPDGADPATERLRLFDAVLALLRAAPGARPIVVVLEDAHWADVDSLRLLDVLAVELHDAPVLVVVTYRDEEAPPGSPLAESLAGLARRSEVARVALRGLARPAISAWAEELLGSGIDARTAAVIEARTEGNPFFVGELVRLLDAERALDADAAADLPIPTGVRDVVRRRIERLPENTRTVMRVAAVGGRDVAFDVVEAACGLDPDALDEALEPALLAGLLGEAEGTAGTLRFSHALVRDALVDDLPVTRRRRLHARLAAAIEDVHGTTPGTHLAAVAHHRAQAAPLGQHAEAARAAVAAARWAEAHAALDDAARYWTMAAEAAAHDPAADAAEVVDITIGRARALLRLGHVEGRHAVAAAMEGALELGDTDRAVHAALSLARHDSTWIWSEYGTVHTDVVDLLERVLTLLGPDDTPERARLLGVLAAGIYYGDVAAGEAMAADALAMARRLGDPEVIRDALVARTATRADQLLEGALELVELGEVLDDDMTRILGQVELVLSRFAIADVEGARQAYEQAELLLRDHPTPVATLQLRHHQPMWSTMEGRWEDTEAAVDRLVGLARQASLFGTMDIRPVQQLLEARREQGRLIEFADLLAVVGDTVTPIGWVLLAIAQVQAGRRAEAIGLMRGRGGPPPPTGDWRRLQDAAHVVEIAVVTGDVDALRTSLATLAEDEGRLTLAGNLDCKGPVDTWIGWAEVHLGEREAGVEHLRRGLALAERLGARPWAARAHLYLAAVLDGPEREEHARAARALATELGIATFVADADRLLAGDGLWFS